MIFMFLKFFKLSKNEIHKIIEEFLQATIILTSVRLIKYAESAADSERTVADMKILKPDSESPNDPPKNPKKILVEISILIEISMDYDFHRIIEYHI